MDRTIGIAALLAGATLMTGATAASASGNAAAASPTAKPKPAGPTFTMQADYQSYTNGFGTRTLVTAAARLPLGKGLTLQLGAATGERVMGGKALRGSGGNAQLNLELVPGLTSRTTFARGEVGPLFASRAVGEEFIARVGGFDLRAGGRLSRYGEGLDVRSFHGGLVRSLGPVKLDYSLAAYARKGVMGSGAIHRFDGALEDRHGTTHLLLAAGSSLHEHDFRPDKVSGSFRYGAIKRKQKLVSGLALELTGGWTDFNRPKADYGAARITAGLVVSR